MAHHGKNIDHPIKDELRKLMKDYRKENENNVWPNGMLRGDDEGIFPMAIGIEKGQIMIRFAEPTAWVGMTPEQAIQMAENLIQKAKQIGLSRMVSITL